MAMYEKVKTYVGTGIYEHKVPRQIYDSEGIPTTIYETVRDPKRTSQIEARNCSGEVNPKLIQQKIEEVKSAIEEQNSRIQTILESCTSLAGPETINLDGNIYTPYYDECGASIRAITPSVMGQLEEAQTIADEKFNSLQAAANDEALNRARTQVAAMGANTAISAELVSEKEAF